MNKKPKKKHITKKSNIGKDTKTIVLGVCAGIAAYKACDIINILTGQKQDVVVCMSKDAHHFISALTLQTLSSNKVSQDMFQPAQEYNPAHISLAQKADLILILPATSNIISKIANGICDELLTCVVAATHAPVVFVPAMNERMYNNPILQLNIDKLKRLGYHFVAPIKGRLACGDTGVGHIADITDILRSVEALTV
jgi:phosphopantothenoylcysteine decarboxylase / phosphopantothenate---cysteine ligase